MALPSSFIVEQWKSPAARDMQLVQQDLKGDPSVSGWSDLYLLGRGCWAFATTPGCKSSHILSNSYAASCPNNCSRSLHILFSLSTANLPEKAGEASVEGGRGWEEGVANCCWTMAGRGRDGKGTSAHQVSFTIGPMAKWIRRRSTEGTILHANRRLEVRSLLGSFAFVLVLDSRLG